MVYEGIIAGRLRRRVGDNAFTPVDEG